MPRARPVAAFALTALLLADCVHVHVDPPVNHRAGLGLEPGDRVVALWGDGFWEGTVLSVEGKLVVLAWDTPPPEKGYAPRAWVQPLDAHPAAAAEGQWLLCPTEARWQLCAVQEIEAGRVRALLAEDGAEGTWPLDALLEIPREVQGWAMENGEQALSYVRLQAELGGLRPASAGQAVQVGEAVVARWDDGHWYTGTAEKVDEAVISVAWGDGSPASVVPRAEVGPIPPQPAQLAAGQGVLCLGLGEGRWWRGRVEQAQGRVLQVRFIDGSLEARDLSQCLAGAE